MQQQDNNEPVIALQLPASMLGVIQECLTRGPWIEVNPVIMELQRQISPQVGMKRRGPGRVGEAVTKDAEEPTKQKTFSSGLPSELTDAVETS